MRVKKPIDYARATSAAAAAAAAALPLLLSVHVLRSTAAMRRLSIDATGANISQAGQEGHGVRLINTSGFIRIVYRYVFFC